MSRSVLPWMILLLPACDGAIDARSAWLSTTLFDDHRDLLLRDPARVADKLERMAETPFDFLRGSLPQWVRDTTEPGGLGTLATRLEIPAASHMLLIGDPHPENLATFVLDDGSIVFDYDDFDAATWGPWTHDLRRLATATRVYFGDRGLASEAALDDLVGHVARGYVFGLDPDAATHEPGVIAADLIARAHAAHDESLVASDTIVAADVDEDRLVRALVAAWPASCLGPCAAGTVRRVFRRFGAGVASLPLLRWYAELEGAGDAVVIELKEVTAPPGLPFPAALTPWSFASNAERVVLAQRLLQSSARSDPHLGWAAIDRWSFRVRSIAPALKDLSRTRVDEHLAEGKWTVADANDFAALCGRRLGEAHRRAPLAPDSDQLAGPILWAELAGQGELLADETMRFAALMADRVTRDHALLVTLLAERGPLLGWDAALAASR